MRRRSPTTGYDFGNKRQYRRDIWATARRWTGGRSKKEMQCLLMPSIEGDEIEVALSNGFIQKNLHVVDENSAIVAHLKRRWPFIKTYGVELAHALNKMWYQKIKLDVVNLDLCGPVTGDLLKRLFALSSFDLLNDSAIVFVTFLRGRERPNVWSWFTESISWLKDEFGPDPSSPLLDALAPGGTVIDRMREMSIYFALMGTDDVEKKLSMPEDLGNYNQSARNVHIYAGKTYRSTAGNQTMRWVGFNTHKRPCVCQLCVSWHRCLTKIAQQRERV